MPFRHPRTYLEDIAGSIEQITLFLAGLDLEGYRADRKTRSAVERELLIISEAAIRLGPEAETLAPGPDWPNIRGIGNTLRHLYHRVDDRIIWNTVQQDLPRLLEAVTKALRQLETEDQSKERP